MSTGCGVELIVWRPVRWRCGYKDQRMELVSWCRSPMAVARSSFKDGNDVVGGYCAGLQASEITCDLCFVDQDSFETLRHRFSWRLRRSSATVFESDYMMKVRNHPRWKDMRLEFQSAIRGLISMRSWCLARLQWYGWVGIFLSSDGVAELEHSSPPMVRLSWNFPILQWCGSVGTFLSSNGAVELEPSFSMVWLPILHPSTVRRKPTFFITSLVFFPWCDCRSCFSMVRPPPFSCILPF